MKFCTVKGVIRDIYYNAPIYQWIPAVFFLPKDNPGNGNRGPFFLNLKKVHGRQYTKTAGRGA